MEQIEKWNRRYAESAGWAQAGPSPLLARAIDGVEPGLALDLACGAGRHSLALAERGWRVVAVDGSRVGVEMMQEKARRLGLEAGIEALVADLESEPRGFRVDAGRYDLICDFFYLERGLFDAVREGVRPGGLFVAAIHVAGGEERHSTNPAFLLEPGELLRLVEGWGWQVLYSSEGGRKPTAEIIARKVIGQ